MCSRLSVILVCVAAVGFASCRRPEAVEPTVILVSLDGVRWDFPARAPTPNLDRLAAEGVRARALVPVFPTLTFPNHQSVVTGLYAEHHGIVANTMYDSVFDARFSLGDRASVTDGRWWGGEPVWVGVERAGGIAAAFFWPGTDTEIDGIRPTHFTPFDASIPHERRVDQVLAWLDLPVRERPSFITLYFSDADRAGHDHGPDAPEVDSAVARVDRSLGRLLGGLEARALLDEVHVVVTSDHGSAQLSRERVIFLDDYLDPATLNITEYSPLLGVWPKDGDAERVYQALAGRHPHLRVYHKAEIPDRFHYRDHRRIPPVIGIADEGWAVTTRAFFMGDTTRFTGGTHGFDNAVQSMHGIFVARGPRLRRGVTVEPFGTIHVYPLLTELLGLPPAPHDASLDSVRPMLVPN